MTNEQIMNGLAAAKSEVNLTRARYTQFALPLADAKLVRVVNYLEKQMALIEIEMWREAELCH